MTRGLRPVRFHTRLDRAREQFVMPWRHRASPCAARWCMRRRAADPRAVGAPQGQSRRVRIVYSSPSLYTGPWRHESGLEKGCYSRSTKGGQKVGFPSPSRKNFTQLGSRSSALWPKLVKTRRRLFPEKFDRLRRAGWISPRRSMILPFSPLGITGPSNPRT